MGVGVRFGGLVVCAAALVCAPAAVAQLPLPTPPAPLPNPTPAPQPPPVPPGPSSAEAPDVASVHGISVRRDNYSADDALAPPLKKLWSTEVGERVSYPLIAEDRIFVVALRGSAYSLHALERTTGRIVWSRDVTSMGSGYFHAYDGGRVFVYDSNRLAAFSAQTGEPLWTHNASSPSGFSPELPIAARGRVYFSSGHLFRSLDAANGEVRWEASNLLGTGTRATLDGRRIYTAESCGNAHAFDMFSGEQAWERRTSCSGGGSDTPVLHDGRLYIEEDNAILDAGSGQHVGSLPRSGAPIFAGDVTVLGLEGGALVGRRGPAGPQLWRVTPKHDGRGGGHAPIAAGGWVYFVRNRALQALDLETGQRGYTTPLELPESGGLAATTGMAAGQGVLAVPNGGRVEVFTSALAPPGNGVEALPRITDIQYGETIPLDGRLGRDLRSGGPREVRAEHDPAPDGGFAAGETARTRRDGTFTVSTKPALNTRLRAGVPGGPMSEPQRVYVYPRLGFSARGIAPRRARVRLRMYGPKRVRLAGRRAHVYLLRKGAKRARRLGGGVLRKRRGVAEARFVVKVPSNVGEDDGVLICSRRLSRAGMGRPGGVDSRCGRAILSP